MRPGNFKSFLIKNKIEYLVFPTDFVIKAPEQRFLALRVNNLSDNYIFSLRNTLNRTTIDSLKESDLNKIKSYPNPIKTWQFGG